MAEGLHRRPFWIAVLVLGVLPAASTAQRVVERYAPVDGYLRIGPEPERRIPMTERGHTLLLPGAESSPIEGVLVFIDPRRYDGWPEPHPGSIDAEALAKGMAVVHMTTGDPLDFLFEERDLRALATRLQAVLDDCCRDDTPVFLAGLSLGGTRALRLAAFLRAHRDRYALQPTAVAVVDAPLDMTRLWAAERQAAELGFHPAAADEGRWVTYLLETNLGGTPGEARDRYVAYSPYTHGEPDGGNAVLLRDVPVRAYHEPDVDWWIEHRRKSYYAMNSLDLAALINRLRILGNGQAELVTTHQRREGYAEGASPHTWSIVDNADLVEWLLERAGDTRPDRGGG